MQRVNRLFLTITGSFILAANVGMAFAQDAKTSLYTNTSSQQSVSPLPAAPAPAAVMAAMSDQAASQQDTQPSDSPSVQELNELRTRQSIIEAKLKIATELAELCKQQASLGSTAISALGTGDWCSKHDGSQQAASSGAKRYVPQVIPLPAVKEIQQRVGHGFQATLLYGDGTTVTVTEGSHLAGGSVVTRIDADGVRVKTAFGPRLLPNASNDPAAQQSSIPSAAPLSAPPMPASLQPMPASTDSTKGGN